MAFWVVGAQGKPVEHKGKKFDGVTVVIDGDTFLDCTFKSCVMQYNGGPSPLFHRNKFIDCEWAFDGAALRTFQFLNSLYQSGATGLVEGVIGFIKTAKPSEEAPRE